ncbi:MAG TPA: molybdopterin cofactor-binding domain-containing protein [Acetobacteraceae bacterium]|nr:molybdopterin cofactor-binding domain-containing protein [Acetobacteraceae bacterium]
MIPLKRRAVLRGGALMVGFVLAGHQHAGGADAPFTGDLARSPYLDSWIRLNPDGRVTVFTGKVELGQGIRTALVQVAAEELDIDPAQVTLITADTARTPDEVYTAGSHSMQDSGTAIRDAAAEVRGLLVGAAAARWGVAPEQLTTRNGAVSAPDGRRIAYGDLAGAVDLHQPAQPPFALKPPERFTLVGRSMPRLDIPAKLTGVRSYVQDLVLPGMAHGRVVRPFAYGGALLAVDVAEAERMPGVLRVVRDGSFLGVIAEREFQAIEAMRALAASARWAPGRRLPEPGEMAAILQHLPAEDIVVLDRRDAVSATGRSLEAQYARPYLAHGSIGPSCAVARFDSGELIIWTHSQGVFPLRGAIAEMLRMPAAHVRCIHLEGAGCYGQNGADDAAADAARLARALPGRPVRLQWMREQEQQWEPYGPAMLARARGTLDPAGRIAAWEYQIWSNTHARRPGPTGVLLAAQSLADPFPPPRPRPIPMPEGGGDRNGVPLYRVPNARTVYHFIPSMPLRVSALRSLGAHLNVFAIESFMDELALAAGADPVAFRLDHLDDPRARDVVRLAAERFGWSAARPGSGRGFAFARYKNLAAYCAIALEVSVDRASGRIKVGRVVAAVDSGQAVNPDGIRNQVEGAIVQATSWTLFEQVGFDTERVTSRDWNSYPILRFDAAPDSIAVHVINRPGAPYLGTGECGQGPASAAIANAVADATGTRLREMPLRMPG